MTGARRRRAATETLGARSSTSATRASASRPTRHGPPVPVVQPGRRVDHAPVWRNRSRAGDQPASRRADGRRRRVESEGVAGEGSRSASRSGCPVADAGAMISSARTDEAALSSRRVLIVDDNATNRRILVTQLDALGDAAARDGSPTEALRWLEARRALRRRPRRPPDAGDRRPGARGALRAGRAIAGLPIVVLSSIGARDREGPGVAARLTKPVKPSGLHDALATALSLASGRVRKPARPAVGRRSGGGEGRGPTPSVANPPGRGQRRQPEARAAPARARLRGRRRGDGRRRSQSRATPTTTSCSWTSRCPRWTDSRRPAGSVASWPRPAGRGSSR